MTATDKTTKPPCTDEEFVGIPPCPEWCTEPLEHGFDNLTNGGGSERYHSAKVGEFVSIVTADVAEIGQPVRRRQPWITIDVDEGQRLDRQQAIDVSDGICMAADKLDEIMGVERFSPTR
ncbi:MAG: hypothetical protein QOJ60_208 [Actinomycetota bacterium]|nr:hypothetical protein [Actinomycetota bacterium]